MGGPSCARAVALSGRDPLPTERQESSRRVGNLYSNVGINIRSILQALVCSLYFHIEVSIRNMLQVCYFKLEMQIRDVSRFIKGGCSGNRV